MQIEAIEKNKPTGKSVLLFSGGMDSLMMAYLLKPDVLLYICHGQKYQSREEKAIIDITYNFEITGIRSVKYNEDTFNFSNYERPDAIIPLRNLYFIQLAAQYGEKIFIGAMRGDRTLDKSETFLTYTQYLLDYLYQDQHWCEGRKFEIQAPYKLYTKSELVAEYLHQGGNPEALKLSYSCYMGDEKPCQRCKACVRKAVALINNNIHVPEFKFEEVEWLQEGTEIYEKIYKNQWRGREDDDFKRAMLKIRFPEYPNDQFFL